MTTNFITYYDDKGDSRYLREANRTKNSAVKFFDSVTVYNRDTLIKEPFYEDNKTILDQTRYAGWCLWKPFYIHKKLMEMEYGDVLFYMDVGDILHYNIKGFLLSIIEQNDGFFLVQSTHSNKVWTTKDCFVLMGCDEPKYWEANQLEAGAIGFKKTDETIKFVEEWLMFCKNEHILTKNNINENHSEYCGDNRADQSVLTNLKIKHDIKTVSIFSILTFIQHNIPG